jgi:pyrimidine-specific ribonucleoside hydrolase
MTRRIGPLLLATGGILIVAGSVAFALRGHRQRVEPATIALLAGFIVAQVGLAAFAATRLRGHGGLAIAAIALLVVPPIVIATAFLAPQAGAPWGATTAVGILALIAVTVGWGTLAAAATRAGVISLGVASSVAWSTLLLFLFQPGSLRALAAVPLGVTWLAIALLDGSMRRPSRRVITSSAAASAVAVALVVGATTWTARPVGVPGLAPTPGATTAVVIDTDSQPDDWMAITYLLARPGVDVRAITVAGSASLGCGDGVRQVLRLLALFDRPEIPVACGRSTPTPGGHSFPPEWRQFNLDLMNEVPLPDPIAEADDQPAADLLTNVLRASDSPVTILELGPLTNLLDAFTADPSVRERVAEIVIMGGAMDVTGNTGSGPAEWNLFVDPAAASYVFRAGRPVTLVALDATNDALVTRAAADEIRAAATTPAGQFVADLLGAQSAFIASGEYYFWDPLAAVALTDGRIAGFVTERLDVSTVGDESGRVIRAAGGGDVQIAVSADEAAFLRTFLATLNDGS